MVRFPVVAKDFSLSPCVQTCLRATPSLLFNGYGSLSPGVKYRGVKRSTPIYKE